MPNFTTIASRMAYRNGNQATPRPPVANPRKTLGDKATPAQPFQPINQPGRKTLAPAQPAVRPYMGARVAPVPATPSQAALTRPPVVAMAQEAMPPPPEAAGAYDLSMFTPRTNKPIMPGGNLPQTGGGQGNTIPFPFNPPMPGQPPATGVPGTGGPWDQWNDRPRESGSYQDSNGVWRNYYGQEIVPGGLGPAGGRLPMSYNDFASWLAMGSDNFKSENAWALLQSLYDVDALRQAQGDVTNAMGLFQNMNTNPDALTQTAQQRLMQLLQGEGGGPLGPQANTPLNAQLGQSVGGLLGSPDVVNDQLYGQMVANTTEGVGSAQQAAMREVEADLARRGITGSLAAEAMANAAATGGAAQQSALRDVDIQRAQLNRGALMDAQNMARGYVDEDFGRRLAEAGFGGDKTLNYLQLAGQLGGQDFNRQMAINQALAGLYMNMPRTAPDFSGVFGTASATRRAVPPPSYGGKSSDFLSGLGGALNLGASFLPFLGL